MAAGVDLDELIELLVRVDGLLNAGKLDELLRELLAFHRIQGVLILKLGREQRQERIERLGEGLGRVGPAVGGIFERDSVDLHGDCSFRLDLDPDVQGARGNARLKDQLLLSALNRGRNFRRRAVRRVGVRSVFSAGKSARPVVAEVEAEAA